MSFAKTPTLRAMEKAFPASGKGRIRISPASYEDLKDGLGPSWAWQTHHAPVPLWRGYSLLIDAEVATWALDEDTVESTHLIVAR